MTERTYANYSVRELGQLPRAERRRLYEAWVRSQEPAIAKPVIEDERDASTYSSLATTATVESGAVAAGTLPASAVVGLVSHDAAAPVLRTMEKAAGGPTGDSGRVSPGSSSPGLVVQAPSQHHAGFDQPVATPPFDWRGVHLASDCHETFDPFAFCVLS